MKGVFRRVGMTIVPDGEEGREALLAVKDGARFAADIRAARNPEQFKLFWKLCGLVADADDDEKENVKKWLLRQLNHIDVSFDPNGTMHIETKSIAYESMEQAEFARLLDRSIPLMAARLGSAEEDFRRQFESLLNPDERAHYNKLRKMKSPPLAPEHHNESITERGRALAGADVTQDKAGET